MDQLRDAGGAVIRFSLGPKWLMPPIVVATSPEAIRDILSNKDAVVDKTTRVLREFRHIIGANLFRSAPRALVATSAHATAGVHQTASAAVRRTHGRGRRIGGGCLAGRCDGQPRRRMPHIDVAGARALGAGTRLDRTRRGGHRAVTGRAQVCHQSGCAAGPSPRLVADTRSPARPRSKHDTSPSCQRHPERVSS
jgi:hypothetical protein